MPLGHLYKGNSTTSLANLFQCSVILTEKKFFCNFFKWNLLCSGLRPLLHFEEKYTRWAELGIKIRFFFVAYSAREDYYKKYWCAHMFLCVHMCVLVPTCSCFSPTLTWRRMKKVAFISKLTDLSMSGTWRSYYFFSLLESWVTR